jgi:hypothetical protein
MRTSTGRFPCEQGSLRLARQRAPLARWQTSVAAALRVVRFVWTRPVLVGVFGVI